MKVLHELIVDGSSRIGIWEAPNSHSGTKPPIFGRNSGFNQNVIECLHQFPGLEKSSIVYDKHGKPYLNDPTLGKISISHSHGLLAIIHDRKSDTGIDLEAVGEKVLRVRHKFLHPDELRHCGENPSAKMLHVYWGVKEALYKFHGRRSLHFSENLRVQDFNLSENGEVIGEIRLGGTVVTKKLRYQFIGQFLLVYIRNS